MKLDVDIDPNRSFTPEGSDEENHCIPDDGENQVVPEESAFANPPNENDVLLGRGKKFYNHSGNLALQSMVNAKLDEYSAAQSKLAKSRIIYSIVNDVREKGGFVKEDRDTGLWVDVGDILARKKVAQTIRDSLSDQYRSSYAFKNKRRSEKNKCCGDTSATITDTPQQEDKAKEVKPKEPKKPKVQPPKKAEQKPKVTPEPKVLPEPEPEIEPEPEVEVEPEFELEQEELPEPHMQAQPFSMPLQMQMQHMLQQQQHPHAPSLMQPMMPLHPMLQSQYQLPPQLHPQAELQAQMQTHQQAGPKSKSKVKSKPKPKQKAKPQVKPKMTKKKPTMGKSQDSSVPMVTPQMPNSPEMEPTMQQWQQQFGSPMFPQMPGMPANFFTPPMMGAHGMFGLQSPRSRFETVDIVAKLSDSLPSCFIEDEDPFEPVQLTDDPEFDDEEEFKGSAPIMDDWDLYYKTKPRNNFASSMA